MREWVVEVEHIFDGSWTSQAEEITNAEVARRFDAYLERLSCFVDAQERTAEEKLRLGHLLKVLTHLRPGLVQCYDIEGFPRTNNEMERTIPKCIIVASVVAKTGTRISYAMGAVSSIKNGGCSNLMARRSCKRVYDRFL